MRRLKQPLRVAETVKTVPTKHPPREVWATRISVVANATIIVSLVVAILSYREQSAQTRRSMTFSIASGLNAGEMLDAQRAISRELLKLNLGGLQDVKLERDTLASLLQKMETASSDPIDFRQDVITIVSYFDDAQVCVEIGSCDGVEMQQRVGTIAQRYACLFLPYVETVKADYLLPGLGDGLKRMADYESHC